jgi:hypothetical protein
MCLCNLAIYKSYNESNAAGSSLNKALTERALDISSIYNGCLGVS